MKVLLIYPVMRNADTMEHLGLGFIAAALRLEKIEVDLFVYYVKKGEDSLLNKIESFKPDVVGFTTFTESLKEVLSVSRKMKIRNTDIKIVLGGHAAVYSAEAIMRDMDSIDFISVGDGELSFVKLVKFLNYEISKEELEGIYYRNEQGNIIFNEIKSKSLLNEDLIPVRDIYEELNPKPPIVLLSTSRGCLGHCSFCGFSGTKIKGIDRWRGRSPEKAVNEIEYLVNKYGMNTFFITDPTFEDPGKIGKERIRRFAEEIINRKLNINFQVHLRAENWHYDDKELLKLLADAGLESVVVGIESASQRTLKIFDKIATVHDNERIVKLLKEAHIILEYGFIMFNPYTTYEDCYDNLTFFNKTNLGHNIKCILTKLEVYPGVGIEKKLRADGLLRDNYTYLDSMFNYKFVDERIKMISEELCKLPEKLTCIDELDVVNTRIKVFITRLWRKFGKGDMKERVSELDRQLDELLEEMRINNVQFIEKCLQLGNNWSNHEFEQLVNDYVSTYIPKKIAQIKKLQFDCIYNMKKNGKDITGLQM